jgi:hypothetical protein
VLATPPDRSKSTKAGKSFFEPRGSRHLVSENASVKEPADLLAAFVADDSGQLTTSDKQGGSVAVGQKVRRHAAGVFSGLLRSWRGARLFSSSSGNSFDLIKYTNLLCS